MYFYVVYGGARRRYGGAGRNSHHLLQCTHAHTSHPLIPSQVHWPVNSTYLCSGLDINIYSFIHTFFLIIASFCMHTFELDSQESFHKCFIVYIPFTLIILL